MKTNCCDLLCPMCDMQLCAMHLNVKTGSIVYLSDVPQPLLITYTDNYIHLSRKQSSYKKSKTEGKKSKINKNNHKLKRVGR